MKKSCNCKTSDKVWGIVSPKTNRLHRLTFSSGLASWLAETDDSYQAARFSYRRGRVLKPTEKSKSGLYAIIGTRKDVVLRMTLFNEGAELLTGCDSRHIEEVFLEAA